AGAFVTGNRVGSAATAGTAAVPSRVTTTERANRFVTEHRASATTLGRTLADLVTEPDRFVTSMERGFRRLADPSYRDAQIWVVPGAVGVIGIRGPLIQAVERPVARALREASPAVSIYLADACSQHDAFEVRLFALVPLRRSLPDDPERSWQIVRRLARRASDWVSVDSLADVVARGLLLEPFRWAEIELLVYSPYRWERRLVAATLAELPFRRSIGERVDLRTRPALSIIGTMIGEADPDVQKALSWALRSWREVDPAGVSTFLRREAATAVETDDGGRAWVVRDALTGRSADLGLAAELKACLAGIRRRPHAPDTSLAHATASAFFVHAMPDPLDVEEAPLDLAPSPVTA
ncbi:MAG TPA: DNA alkylation repair protein, partial [Candidatus Saccharimonadia bacterium]|nr:DNA alkylation repair protein [Candidatus Saccharimonadia bacterium]